jgi:hypothetical protein
MAVLDGALVVGTWGGDSAGMIVSDATTHLHIGCTFGDVAGRIPIDTHGEFDVSGSYLLRAYPIAVGPTLPARFVGRLDRTTVTVTVTIDDTINKQTVVRGPAVVTLGTEPRLGPCPICKQPAIERGFARKVEAIGTGVGAGGPR